MTGGGGGFELILMELALEFSPDFGGDSRREPRRESGCGEALLVDCRGGDGLFVERVYTESGGGEPGGGELESYASSSSDGKDPS